MKEKIKNYLRFLKAMVNYAKSCAAILPQFPPVEDYTYVFCIYDISGSMIWDSHTPDLLIYKEDSLGNLSYQKLDLLNCPFGSSVSIFQLDQRPYFLPYIRTSGGTTDELAKMFLRSQFVKSALDQAENILSIGSFLIDNQNTRNYSKPRFGIGNRLIQVMDPDNPDLTETRRGQGFYVTYNSRIVTRLKPTDRNSFGFMTLRLGLEKYNI